MTGLDKAARRSGVPARSTGFPATTFIRFDHEREADCDRAMRLFCNGMLDYWHLITPAHRRFICAAMTEADIDGTVRAAEATLVEMSGMICTALPAASRGESLHCFSMATRRIRSSISTFACLPEWNSSRPCLQAQV
ncbi:hypothetical protein [Hoeflea ulvae]|uniref:Uncharacterized protein n=1 Tax=Hoeflea ulvae TaxID=2983764 RepID=A0ABT3YF57_9HYPH|nr:hypothetical protein [Hoeflea ulvae]MCY0094539.1 hypothetical protein [Hoeflea ulvae]